MDSNHTLPVRSWDQQQFLGSQNVEKRFKLLP